MNNVNIFHVDMCRVYDNGESLDG